MFSPLLEDLFVGNVSGQGRLSPRGKVTMSKTDKRVAAIPVEATSFSFLYPLPNLADALSLLDMAVRAQANSLERHDSLRVLVSARARRAAAFADAGGRPALGGRLRLLG